MTTKEELVKELLSGGSDEPAGFGVLETIIAVMILRRLWPTNKPVVPSPIDPTYLSAAGHHDDPSAACCCCQTLQHLIQALECCHAGAECCEDECEQTACMAAVPDILKAVDICLTHLRPKT